MANKNKKLTKNDWILMISIITLIAAICTALVILVVKFYKEEHHEEIPTENNNQTPTEPDTYDYPKYDNASDTKTEGGVIDTSNTGLGINVDNEKIAEYIDAYKYENFAKSEQVTDFVCIRVQGMGDIIVALRSDIAPETVNNFKKLVSNGHYKNTLFNLIKPFSVQGGNTSANGETKETDSIYGEFTANGFLNNLLHIRGVVSMGRFADRNSATSQFFVMTKDSTSLENENYIDKYNAAFGYVLEGMEVVDKIATAELVKSDKETNPNAGAAPKQKIIIKEIFFLEPKENTKLAVKEAPEDKRVEYKLKFTDAEGNGIQNLMFRFVDQTDTGEIIATGVVTNENGEASIYLEPKYYRVMVIQDRKYELDKHYDLDVNNRTLKIENIQPQKTEK